MQTTVIENKFSPQHMQILYLKDSTTPRLTIPDLASSEKKDAQQGREPLLICKFCKNIITSHKDIIEVDGSHTHEFTNPGGITFLIGCFQHAKGCVTMGEPTNDYTWFEGFSWSIALCSHCFNHMGWFYEAGSNNFFGLILNNLKENFISFS